MLEYLANPSAYLGGMSTSPWLPLIFLFIYICAEILLLPGMPFALASGLFFGFYQGIFLSIIASVSSAMIIIYVLRFAGASHLSRYLQARFEFLKRYNTNIEHTGFWQVFVLRITPGIPANFINTYFAFTGVKPRDFFLATLIGNLPSTAVLVYLGSLATKL